MRKIVLTAALAVAALPVAANASFVVTYPSIQPVPVFPAQPASNNFYEGLAVNGITSFASTGATLALTTSGLLKFEFFGNEALLQNKFTVGGISFSTSSSYVNNFTVGPGATSTPLDIGTAFFTSGTFNPTFFTNGIGPAVTPGSTYFGIGLPVAFNPAVKVQSGTYTTDSIWLMFDDNTGNPDDNHDDLIIRVTAVPEPGTWAMMILGFGVIGLVMRRRAQPRVSFV